MLALIYLQAWSVLLCTHIYIRMLRGVNTAYGVKGCVSNTACVIIVMHVVMWFYANIPGIECRVSGWSCDSCKDSGEKGRGNK